ncbi:MAG: acetylglutamate kinase, partial [Desulfovibrio sp.]|nr:acetylglutamate kinase [Desulfovibrio sp.]
LSRLNQAEIAELIRAGVISGGMLPKVEACLNALALGAGSALILDGRAKSSLYRHLAQGEALGTVIVP